MLAGTQRWALWCVCVALSDDSELSEGAKQALRERNCHKPLTEVLRDKVIARISKEELRLAHVVRLLRSRRQEEDDISSGVASLRSLLAKLEAEVRVTAFAHL